ncbi:MAG TPA: hypothetical protein VFA60_01815 [Terriglobales bacterium]|nr:hypothetical protein [Terriglobales bacterium]
MLAAPLAAQELTSRDQEQTQQAPQQPTSPLQEPAKPSEAELNKPKAATFEVGNAVAAGSDQEVGEIRLMTRATEIGGDKTRSFRVDGQNNLGEFNYFMDRRFLVTRRMQVLTMFRATDDASIDPEHNSLQKAYLRFYGPRDEYIFGDSLVSLSRLTFNQNIKGVNASWKFNDVWKLTTIGGAFVDRYGSFYKELCTASVTTGCLPGRPYTSLVSGFRLERKVGRENTFGLNFSSSDDRVDTLPPATLGTPPLPASNRVFSFDGKVQRPGFRMEGEIAASSTDFDTRSSASCPAPCDDRIPQAGLGYQGDWGGRLESSWRRGKFNLRGSYTRYEPNFASINARQIADLQDSVLRASYDVLDWLTLDSTVRRSNDDLKQQLQFETRLLQPEVRFVVHDLGFYRRGLLEFGYRQRNVDAFAFTGNCANGATDCRVERFVRIPFAELTIPYHSTFLTVGWERRQAVDLIDASQTSNTNRWYASLRGVYDLGGWHINPNMRIELERQAQRPRIGQTTTPLEFLLDYDSNRLAIVGFYVEPPKWFIMEASYRSSSATLPALSPTGLTLVPAGYSRPSYKTALTYKWLNDENTTITFAFERNSNFYRNSPNFDERSFGVTLVYKFGRRGK